MQLVERIYNYCAKLYPKTKVMVSGIREKQGESLPAAKAVQPPSASHG